MRRNNIEYRLLLSTYEVCARFPPNNFILSNIRMNTYRFTNLLLYLPDVSVIELNKVILSEDCSVNVNKNTRFTIRQLFFRRCTGLTIKYLEEVLKKLNINSTFVESLRVIFIEDDNVGKAQVDWLNNNLGNLGYKNVKVFQR